MPLGQGDSRGSIAYRTKTAPSYRCQFVVPKMDLGSYRLDTFCYFLYNRGSWVKEGKLDLPRFRGQLRSWDQATLSDFILLVPSCSSCLLEGSFCSAPAEPILPSRPAHSTRRRAEGRSRPR